MGVVNAAVVAALDGIFEQLAGWFRVDKHTLVFVYGLCFVAALLGGVAGT